MDASEIRWNEQARQKILDDSDRVLREAVVDIASSGEHIEAEAAFEEINARMKGRFIDYQPGPDVRKYAEAIARGEIGTDAAAIVGDDGGVHTDAAATATD